MEAALLVTCGQSLASERKKAVAEQRQGSTSSRVHPSRTDANSYFIDNSDATATTGNTIPRDREDQHLPSSAMKKPEDKAGDVIWDDSSMRAAQTEEKHHEHLYRRRVDSFSQQRPILTAPQRRMTHPRLKHIKGHIGAEELWDILRKESIGKLIKNDQLFPQELKSTFSAFVRENMTKQRTAVQASLTKHYTPVRRSYCATEDVPDIERLMDQSKLHHIHLQRYKAELMYRASTVNQHRTTMLLHHNPLPDVNSHAQQGDVIGRYLPSSGDAQSASSEESYMKWVKAAGGSEVVDDSKAGRPRRSAHSQTASQLLDVCSKPSSGRHNNMPRLQFLIEKDCQFQGGFAQKFQEDKNTFQSSSLPKPLSAGNFPTPAISSEAGDSRRGAYSAMQLERYTCDWQPLSLQALLEYKKKLHAEGQGDFQHGRMRMWPVERLET